MMYAQQQIVVPFGYTPKKKQVIQLQLENLEKKDDEKREVVKFSVDDKEVKETNV